jgi:hypothetical protein
MARKMFRSYLALWGIIDRSVTGPPAVLHTVTHSAERLIFIFYNYGQAFGVVGEQ